MHACLVFFHSARALFNRKQPSRIPPRRCVALFCGVAVIPAGGMSERHSKAADNPCTKRVGSGSFISRDVTGLPGKAQSKAAARSRCTRVLTSCNERRGNRAKKAKRVSVLQEALN